MKKGAKIALFIGFLLIISVVGIYLVPSFLNIDLFFNPGARYDSSVLKLNVIFEDPNDIYAVNGGYSTTRSCPWGRVHEGFDFAFKNNSNVIAGAPGKVTEITYDDWGEDSGENRFMIHVYIRFNKSIELCYCFEPWTNISANWDHQKQLIQVKEGDWVQEGDIVGVFLNAGSGAHIHFDLKDRGERIRLDKYYTPVAYDEMMDLVHIYHPEWPFFCFDENTPLVYLDVIWDNPSDVQWISPYARGVYNPMHREHLGIDIQFNNNSIIRAAAPGQVTMVEYKDWGSGVENRYMVGLMISYNDTTMVGYNFEPWTGDMADFELQKSMITVEEGDWVIPGQEIGRFLFVGPSAHIHHDVVENWERLPMDRYYGDYGYSKMLNLYHTFLPNWQLIYDSTILNKLGVIYNTQADIYSFEAGFSTTDSCPWGYEHLGINYHMNDGVKVLAAAPGNVSYVGYNDLGLPSANRYQIIINITYNETVEFEYRLNIYAATTFQREVQLAQINVTVGTWVEKGYVIAILSNNNIGLGHIDFRICESGDYRCPIPYFSVDDYTEIMDMVHSYHPTWNLFYS
ncbi:MAG: peptidoglycan DD-metalloendopeptidase family protein [Candidatus Lokiarchaeota archaeon]|nr:peptidoglycan DD-metalloendopeptidase family protein [Candidatus Lokiarchaeota archaeon]